MKILLADADRDFCELLVQRLQLEMPAARVKVIHDGRQLVSLAAEEQPALIVVNLLLPEKDGLSAMKAIRVMNLPKQPELFVISGYLTPKMQEELCRLRPAFFTALPCDLQALAEQIRLCCRDLVYRSSVHGEDADTYLTMLLRNVGLTMHCKGFTYLRCGFEYLMDKPLGTVSITKELYPYIAQRYQTTAVNVERAIRSAVMAAWQREGYLLQQELFRTRPTNSEFFAVIVDQLRQAQRISAMN